MQLFLIESAQSSILTALHSGLDRDHLWCWLKKGASSAGPPDESAAQIPRKFPRLFDIIGMKIGTSGITAI